MADLLCARCEHGVVYQRKRDLGMQDTDKTAWCSFMKKEVPPDLTFCSQLLPMNSKVPYWRTFAEPEIINTPQARKKQISNFLMQLLRTQLLR